VIAAPHNVATDETGKDDRLTMQSTDAFASGHVSATEEAPTET